jgi:hypothetical protein
MILKRFIIQKHTPKIMVQYKSGEKSSLIDNWVRSRCFSSTTKNDSENHKLFLHSKKNESSQSSTNDYTNQAICKSSHKFYPKLESPGISFDFNYRNEMMLFKFHPDTAQISTQEYIADERNLKKSIEYATSLAELVSLYTCIMASNMPSKICNLSGLKAYTSIFTY